MFIQGAERRPLEEDAFYLPGTPQKGTAVTKAPSCRVASGPEDAVWGAEEGRREMVDSRHVL